MVVCASGVQVYRAGFRRCAGCFPLSLGIILCRVVEGGLGAFLPADAVERQAGRTFLPSGPFDGGQGPGFFIWASLAFLP
ncbi:hypothetical protein NDU88_003010 [Pleurodeles waltl]|uniref:Uncharacterized protein n=1 Tax=Pleurodeles waltl TaxID=8319 RepID=A0AAV7NGX1_PLEWA|nr:hypothetical protein NDU88_003010 [Pleurodeles waltl]